MEPTPKRKSKPARNEPEGKSTGRCLCGAVEIEIALPAFWAWHDHSRATQRAHGTAYATYIGCWKSKVKVIKGKSAIRTIELDDAKRLRSFCSRCGSPLMYERSHSPKMVNLPRALFDGRTGREPRYHVGIDQAPEWAYQCEPLTPLKGYPGVMQSRPRKRKLREQL
ncbi:MAG: GFA family protein [Micropepsaceae bacterium]